MNKSKHEKGLDFEKRVANYYRDQGYDNVTIRERIRGGSGVPHEVDVAVFDSDEFENLCIACQCKYKETGKVTKNDIAKWRDKCEDMGAEPHYASTRFNKNAKRYADRRDVEIVTREEIENISVESRGTEAWGERLECLDSEFERVVFCLESIRKTGILEEAAGASKQPVDELKFHSKDLYELYRNPETQYGTKILKSLNRVKSKYGFKYAFGSQRNMPFMRKGNGEGFRLPSELEDRSREIEKVLKRVETPVLVKIATETARERFEIFIEAWRRLSKTKLNPYNMSTPFYASKSSYKDKKGVKIEKNYVIEIDRGKISESLKENKIEPQEKFWKSYYDKLDEIDKINQLFEADIRNFDENHQPLFCKGSQEKTSMLNIFNTAKIIDEAYQNNSERIEKMLSKI